MKATGGFYYVQTGDGLLECRAKGIFRKEKIAPYVGDLVEAERTGEGAGVIARILPRKNALARPPVANLDQMVVVLSVEDPAPNFTVTDSLIAILEHKRIEPVIAITKSDLQDAGELEAVYAAAGFPVFVACGRTGEGVPALARRLAGRISAFSGNSGVGKSTLLNAIDPRFSIETGVTSKKLGRGRHTTRHVELFCLPGGGMAADTPGFSSVDLLRASDLRARDLAGYFREFAPFTGQCKFRDCTHTGEKGCRIAGAVQAGEIPRERYESYRQIYGELKDVKEWERTAPVG